jgi:predicted alpha/beta hydrolase family esterase
MPNEADPQYEPWKAALQQELAMLEPGALLVGHSVGGTILINALAESAPKLNLGGIFLIAAPFVGDGGWPSDDVRAGEHLGAALSGDMPVYLYHGSADDSVPFAHVDLYAQAIPHAVVRRLDGRDHQLNNDLAEVAQDIRALT